MANITKKQVFNSTMIEMTDEFTLIDMLGVTAVYSGISYDDSIIQVHITPMYEPKRCLTNEELLSIDCETISAHCILL